MSRFAPSRSKDMERATHMLRTGQTRGQQNQALVDKAMFAGVQAALVGGQALAGRYESDKLQEEQANRGQMQRAIENQTAMRDRDARHSAEASQYADANQVAELGVGGRPMPGWLQQEGVDQGKEKPVQSMAEIASKNQGLNAAAGAASIGGFRTPKGLDDTENEADMRAADINTGKSMMKTGGMMNSLARTR